MLRISSFLFLLGTLLLFTNCKKEVVENDIRLIYVGNWNFKQTTNTYSGNYVYGESGTSPQWVSNTTTNVAYNDNTGSIRLGVQKNELILKYSSSSYERVINLDENAKGSWTLSETTFEDAVQPSPPSYSSYYTTVMVQGEKL